MYGQELTTEPTSNLFWSLMALKFDASTTMVYLSLFISVADDGNGFIITSNIWSKCFLCWYSHTFAEGVLTWKGAYRPTRKTYFSTMHFQWFLIHLDVIHLHFSYENCMIYRRQSPDLQRENEYEWSVIQLIRWQTAYPIRGMFSFSAVNKDVSYWCIFISAMADSLLL